MKFLKNFFKSKKMILITTTSTLFTVILSACGTAAQPIIDLDYNNSTNLASNFDLKNLKQNNLLTSILRVDLNQTQKNLTTVVANHLLYNWSKNFITDESVDKGSSLFTTQEAVKKLFEQAKTSYQNSYNSFINSRDLDWQKLFQRVLNGFGGTQEGWNINHIGPAVVDRLLEAIFSKLYLSYQKTEANDQKIYVTTISSSELNKPENIKNIVFYPSNDDLAIGNTNYQKMFANFQAFVFNYWITHERPFIGWNVNWDYGTSSVNTLANIYNTDKLGENNVTLPTAPNYNFPVFNNGDNNTNSGILTAFNAWQNGVKTKTLFNKTTGGLSLNSVFNTSDKTSPASSAWKIYDNSDLSAEHDGYLSSAILHQYNKLFDSNTSLINEIDLSSSDKKWTDDQLGDPLQIFLDQKNDTSSSTVLPSKADSSSSSSTVKTTASLLASDTKNTTATFKINNQIIFNQINDKFKNKNLIYPIRDIKTDNNKSYWTVTRTQKGFSAISIDGAPLIETATSLSDKNQKIKNNFLWRQGLFSFGSKNDNNINPDLLNKLKEYAKNNFSEIIGAYATQQLLDSKKLYDLSPNTNLFFNKEQNFLLTNQQQLADLIVELNKYVNIIKAQKNYVNLRNNLAITVSSFATKPFVKVDDKIYPPYENGLATPLGFKRNLNTTEDDEIYKVGETNPTFKNDGDYSELSKFYVSDKINQSASEYKLDALSKIQKTTVDKIEKWLQTLKNSNEGLFYNKENIFFNSIEFNYLFNALTTAQNGQNLANHLKNLFLANEINFDYLKNKINFDTSKFELKNDFPSDSSELNSKINDAIAETFYGQIYNGSVGNINNGKDFIGGYKIIEDTTKKAIEKKVLKTVAKTQATSGALEELKTDNTTTNIASYLKKIKSYWNQALYGFSDNGYNLANTLNSNYVKTLYSIEWLLNNKYANLLNFLQSQIGFNSYGAIVWAQEQNLNQYSDAGVAEKENKDFKLKDIAKNFAFIPNPNNVLSNPYFSYNLEPPKTLQTNNSVFNFIAAKAPTKIASNSGSTTISYTNLSGFYGLALANKSLLNPLPKAVQDAVFTNFSKANPDGNLSIFDTSVGDKKVLSRGKLFGSAILNTDGKFDLNQTLNFFVNSLKQLKTFAALDRFGEQLSNIFSKVASNINAVLSEKAVNQLEPKKNEDGMIVSNQFVESSTLPILTINLKQKINAMVNVLNGMQYSLDRTNNETLKESFNKIFNKNFIKPNDFHLFTENDLRRFIGAIQNPKSEETIFPNLKYFIPNDTNSRTGYVSYIIQINNEDVSNIAKFKSFIQQIGFDAFIKTVINLAQDSSVQSQALNDFVIQPKFKKLELTDQRVVNLMGLNWATLMNKKK